MARYPPYLSRASRPQTLGCDAPWCYAVPVDFGLGLATLEAAAGVVSSYVRGKASASDLHQLAVRYWGCVLFELHYNLGALIAAVEKNAYPILHFGFSTTVIPDLARIAPIPAAISVAAVMVGSFRHIHEMVALDQDVSSRPRPAGLETIGLNVRGQWRSYVTSNLAVWRQQFDALRDAVNDQGRVAFGAGRWQVEEPGILPPLLVTPGG